MVRLNVELVCSFHHLNESSPFDLTDLDSDLVDVVKVLLYNYQSGYILVLGKKLNPILLSNEKAFDVSDTCIDKL